MSEEKKELKEEQLSDVAGGNKTVGGYEFSGFVGKYNGVVGTNYYFVYNVGFKTDWWLGTLIKSYEKDNVLIGTTRTHVVEVRFHNDEMVNKETMEFNGDRYEMYTNIRKL